MNQDDIIIGQKQTFDLSDLPWEVSGYNPHEWKLDYFAALGVNTIPEVPPVPVSVPGSVQKALLDSGVLPDWNVGLNAKLCEWVENRHWVYQVQIPDEWLRHGKKFRLRCKGLDHSGWILLNSREVCRFKNAHIEYTIDLTKDLVDSGNILQFIFECPPRWLGQFNYTSKIKEWKPRWYYFWDWTSRLVQIGIWDSVIIEVIDQAEIEDLRVSTDFDPISQHGKLEVHSVVQAPEDFIIRAELSDSNNIIKDVDISVLEFSNKGLTWNKLNIHPWWPSGMGNQRLYDLKVTLLDNDGNTIDSVNRRIGFKHIAWEKCRNAPKQAPPWICVVNGIKVFLQGVNWTPIRLNFADVGLDEYKKRIKLYHDLGFNSLRIWGGGFMEKDFLYDLCDELGLMLWVEFPLTNSGLEGYAPDDEQSIAELSETARSFVECKQHHVSIMLWCGGNELRTNGDHTGLEHPLLKSFNDIIRKMDPSRRFIPTSPYGPRFDAEKELYGKELHWDVHGPWRALGSLYECWYPYWEGDDALMRSELGTPAPSSIELIRKYKGDSQEFPANVDNLFWRRHPWWVDWPHFVKEIGREPENLKEYVDWGQKRQSDALSYAVKSCKNRFPDCGGVMIWIGHDCFPANSSCAIIDFEGNPKPAAIELSKILKAPAGDTFVREKRRISEIADRHGHGRKKLTQKASNE